MEKQDIDDPNQEYEIPDFEEEEMDSESEAALVQMKYSIFYDIFETERVFLRISKWGRSCHGNVSLLTL